MGHLCLKNLFYVIWEADINSNSSRSSGLRGTIINKGKVGKAHMIPLRFEKSLGKGDFWEKEILLTKDIPERKDIYLRLETEFELVRERKGYHSHLCGHCLFYWPLDFSFFPPAQLLSISLVNWDGVSTIQFPPHARVDLRSAYTY